MEVLNTDYSKYVDNEIKWYKNHRDCFVSDFNLDDDDYIEVTGDIEQYA